MPDYKPSPGLKAIPSINVRTSELGVNLDDVLNHFHTDVVCDFLEGRSCLVIYRENGSAPKEKQQLFVRFTRHPFRPKTFPVKFG